ncbi:hypothetical protein O5629_27935, partial [Escherichia coli]|nr:hypothetical protein [Escherichia coli]
SGFALRRADSWRTASVAELICRCRNGSGAGAIGYFEVQQLTDAVVIVCNGSAGGQQDKS